MEERTDIDIADIAQKIVELLVCLRCFVLRILRADLMEQATSAFAERCQGCTHMEPVIVGGRDVDASVCNEFTALLDLFYVFATICTRTVVCRFGFQIGRASCRERV